MIRLFLPLILAVLSGCVYFNTFYNAQVAYKTARKEHKKLEKTRPDSISTLPKSVEAGYDTAISKSNKVMTVFHKNEDWHDNALFLIGRSQFYKGEYARAIRRLRQLQEEFPESPFVPESYLYLGKAHLKHGNLNRAEELFATIEKRYPGLNEDEEISFLRAQIAIEREGKAHAIELLEKVKSSVRDPHKKLELFLQIAELHIEMRQYEKAIALLQEAPRPKNASHLFYQLDLALSTCYLELDSLSRSLEIVSKMQEKRHYAQHLSTILFRKGVLLSRLERYDESISTFEKLTIDHPEDSIAGEAWMQLAEIYQKDKADFIKARECYSEAVKLLKDEEKRELAKERLAAIEELMAFWGKTSPTSDSLTEPKQTAVNKADTSDTLDHFHIAELFWLSLGEPDSALKHYIAVSTDTSGKKDSVSKALYVAGWISMKVLGDSASADSILSVLVDRYPASEYAKVAQQVLGEDITVKTRADSAMVKYAHAEQILYAEKNPSAAADAFEGVHELYPDQPYGAKALYAAAYINDFVLEKNKSAFDLYRQLCREHPENDLCLREAKPRLKVVSDTLRVRKARRRLAKQKGKNSTASEEKSQPQPPRFQKASGPTPIVRPQKKDTLSTTNGHPDTTSSAPDELNDEQGD